MAAVDVEPYPFYPDEAEQNRAVQIISTEVPQAPVPAPTAEIIEARVIEPEAPRPESRPEQPQAYRLDVGVAEHGPVGAIHAVRNADQRFYAIIEGKEFTIDADGQRDPGQDASHPIVTGLVADTLNDYWGRQTTSQLSVEDAATLMHNSLTLTDDLIDAAQNGEVADKELNYNAVAIRFFEDTDGNLRAVYGRSGRGTVLSQTGLNNPVEFARPEDEEEWQPTFVDVTPPLAHNTRLVLTSHGLTPVLEQQDAEVLAQAYDHNSEQAAAEALLQLGSATKARTEAQGALVIDVVKDPSAAAKTPVSDQTVTASSFAKIAGGLKEETQSPADEVEEEEPISWRDVAQGAKLWTLDAMTSARNSLRKLFGRGKAYVQSGEFTRHRKQISGRVLGALATAKEAAPGLISRERYANVSQKLGHLARAAYLAPVNAPQLIAKAGEYFRDEEKGKRRAYAAYAGGIAVAAAFAYFASKGFSLDHHASEAHQQALNHLPKGSGSQHAQAAHHAAANTPAVKHPTTPKAPSQTSTAPAQAPKSATQPVTPAATTPAETAPAPTARTVTMTPGDTIWHEGVLAETTPSNPNPTLAQEVAEMHAIMNANHVLSEAQAQNLQVGTVLTIPAIPA